MNSLKWWGGSALIMILMVSLVVPALAQDEVDKKIGIWQNDVSVSLNMLQSSYSQNWNGGEKGSLNWTGNLDAKFEKQFTELTNWRNILKLAYGQSHKQDRDGNNQLFWEKPDKTDDIIDFESLFRWTPASGWDPYVAFTFKSLFEDLTDEYDRSITFNPISLKESAGISRPWINTEDRQLMSRLGIALIQNNRTFFLDPTGVGTETSSENSNELAVELITEYKVGALDGRVDWESKLTLTLPFIYSGKSTFEDDMDRGLLVAPLPEDIAEYSTNLDMDWENTFTANITSVIAVKLFVRWVYDKYDNTVAPAVDDTGKLLNESDVRNAIRKAGQFKQTMALGLTYKFM